MNGNNDSFFLESVRVKSSSDIDLLDYICVIYAITISPFFLTLDEQPLNHFIKLIAMFGLYVFAFVKYVKTLNTYEKVFYGIGVLLTTALYFLVDQSFFAVITLGGICFKNVPLSKLFKTAFFSQLSLQIIYLLLFLVFGYNSIYNNPAYEQYNRPERYTLGFIHTNYAASHYIFVIIMYYCYKQKASLWDLILFSAGEVYIFKMTNSRTGLLIFMIIVLFVVIGRFVTFNDKFVKLLFASFILFILISYVGPLFLDNSKLNNLLSGRFTNGHQIILQTNYSIKNILFGQSLPYPVDMYYLNMLYETGLIATVFLISLQIVCIYYICKNFNDKSKTMFVLLFLVLQIFGLSEKIIRIYNNFIFILPFVCFDSYKKSIFYRRKILGEYGNIDIRKSLFRICRVLD